MPSPAAHRLTLAHRAELAALGAVVAQEVSRIAATVDVADVDGWWERTVDGLVELVLAAFSGSRTLATRYLREHAALDGRVVEPVAALWSTERARTSLRVTGPVAWKGHLALTGDVAGATVAMRETLAASAQRLALTGSRDTVDATVDVGGPIVGWRRVVDEDPCAFCAMLASRGAVYTSEAAAAQVVGRAGGIRGTRALGMAFHDGDECVVEPLYVGEEEPPEVIELQERWERVTAGHSGQAAIRAWRRDWEGQHGVQRVTAA